jgi:hypothetical protein
VWEADSRTTNLEDVDDEVVRVDAIECPQQWEEYVPIAVVVIAFLVRVVQQLRIDGIDCEVDRFSVRRIDPETREMLERFLSPKRLCTSSLPLQGLEMCLHFRRCVGLFRLVALPAQFLRVWKTKMPSGHLFTGDGGSEIADDLSIDIGDGDELFVGNESGKRLVIERYGGHAELVKRPVTSSPNNHTTP